MTRTLEELETWMASLPAEFAFLAALPFVVALAGLLAYRTGGRGCKRRASPGRDGRDSAGSERIGVH